MRRASTPLSRLPGVLLMLVAWLLASNRCALAMLAAPPSAPVVSMAATMAHQCCSAAKPPLGQHDNLPAKRVGECCQKLGVLPTEPEGKWLDGPRSLVALAPLWAAAWWEGDVVWLSVPIGDEALPTPTRTEWPSCGELVWQGSTRSLAPPVVS